jgi:hypothetical protein
MKIIEEIKKYKSISTIGLGKNVGKTETLNYILNKLTEDNLIVGITSIGIDGEVVDQVTATSKPEIIIPKGGLFVTSEKHYRSKKFQSEVLDISVRTTSLGRVVTSRSLSSGKIMLSGPSNSTWIKSIIDNTLKKGADIVIVDGALSRLSVGSPIITEGIILSTGAAISNTLSGVLKKTKHLINLLELPTVGKKKKEKLENLEDGVYILTQKNLIEKEMNPGRIKREKLSKECNEKFDYEIIKLPIKSILHFSDLKENIFQENNSIFITGVLTERFLEYVSRQENVENIEIIVKDFTKIFTTPEILMKFLRKNGKLKVLFKTNLIAITINPTSPTGHTLDSKILIENLKELVQVPVLNLREEE